MSDDTFRGLFAAAWVGDHGGAVAALADWISDHAPGPNDRAIETDYRYSHADADSRGVLTVYSPAGLPGTIGVCFTEPSLGICQRMHYPPEKFCARFPGWLAEQLDFLGELLSK